MAFEECYIEIKESDNMPEDMIPVHACILKDGVHEGAICLEIPWLRESENKEEIYKRLQIYDEVGTFGIEEHVNYIIDGNNIILRTNPSCLRLECFKWEKENIFVKIGKMKMGLHKVGKFKKRILKELTKEEKEEQVAVDKTMAKVCNGVLIVFAAVVVFILFKNLGY